MRRKNRLPCEYCDGVVRQRRVTEEQWSNRHLVIIEDVPVGICDRCGERYYDAVVVRTMEGIAANRSKIRRKIQVPVAKFRLPASAGR